MVIKSLHHMTSFGTVLMLGLSCD